MKNFIEVHEKMPYEEPRIISININNIGVVIGSNIHVSLIVISCTESYTEIVTKIKEAQDDD